MKTFFATAISLAAAVLVLGCNGRTNATMNGANPLDTTPPTVGPNPTGPGGTGGTPPPAPHCDFGQSYTGFAGIDLTSDRVDSDIGVDRGRVKPYSALTTEYPRVLGNTPALIPQMASTFSSPPPRWFSEPQGSAITEYSSFRVAFQGCLSATSGTAFSTAPSSAKATQQCTTWATSFWSRIPTTSEVSACSDYAVSGTTTETNANRRWAYACASVLTGTGFLTY
jgi:hypothetical protein